MNLVKLRIEELEQSLRACKLMLREGVTQNIEAEDKLAKYEKIADEWLHDPAVDGDDILFRMGALRETDNG